MNLKQILVITCLVIPFFTVFADANSFTIQNNTDSIFSNIKVADPTIRSIDKQIVPHSSMTIQLSVQPKSVIRLATADGKVQTIVFFPYNDPPLRCVDGDFTCTHLTLSGVVIN